MSLGNEFRDIMRGLDEYLPQGAINEAAVEHLTHRLNQLSALEELASRIELGTGKVKFLEAGSVELRPGGLRITGNQTFAVFTGEQAYNAEAVSDGDIVIGSNKPNEANIYWDKSSGILEFRGGTTVKGYIDTDGSAVFGSGDVRLDDTGIVLNTGSSNTNQIRWKNSSGAGLLQIYSNYSAVSSKPYSYFIQNAQDITTQSDMYFETHAGSSVSTADSHMQFYMYGRPNAIGDVFEFYHMPEGESTVRWFMRGKMDSSGRPLLILSTGAKSSNDGGAQGAISIDPDYIYVHSGAQWKRAALTTF